jgi:molybdopterin converting factor small subunit
MLITVKFFGGAKKSFSTDSLSLENDEFTIQELLDYLLDLKPRKTPELDVNNILVAVNGVDSSAIRGKSTKLKPNDVVSIIPVIHGGSSRIQFRIDRTQIELLEVNNNDGLENEFLDKFRKKLIPCKKNHYHLFCF